MNEECKAKNQVLGAVFNCYCASVFTDKAQHMATKRKLPIGIQPLSEIMNGGYAPRSGIHAHLKLSSMLRFKIFTGLLIRL